MGDGYWTPTAAPGGEFYGLPGVGCFFRRLRESGEPGDAFFTTGGVHALWAKNGAETGPLGFPTSNWDNFKGYQTFEGGVIFWDGDSFESGPEPKNARPFNLPAPPPVP